MLRDDPFPALCFALEAAEAIAVNLMRMAMVQGRMTILEIGDSLEGNDNLHLDPAYSPIPSLRIVSISSKKRGGMIPSSTCLDVLCWRAISPITLTTCSFQELVCVCVWHASSYPYRIYFSFVSLDLSAFSSAKVRIWWLPCVQT